jgi:hypothetical protein
MSSDPRETDTLAENLVPWRRADDCAAGRVKIHDRWVADPGNEVSEEPFAAAARHRRRRIRPALEAPLTTRFFGRQAASAASIVATSAWRESLPRSAKIERPPA